MNELVLGNFESFLQVQLKELLLERDLDYGIFIAGMEGSGKSNTCLNIALACSNYLKFDTSHITYEPDDFMRLSTEATKSVIVADEGGDLLYSRDFSGKENKGIVKQMIGNRFLNNLTIINYPRLKYLDTNYRDHRVNLLGLNFAEDVWNPLTQQSELQMGHCYFFTGSKVPLVMEYFEGMYKQGKDFYNVNHVDALRKYVNPDFYCLFPSLKEICEEEHSPFWNDYLKKKKEAHDKRGQKYFNKSLRNAVPKVDDDIPKPKRKKMF